MVNVGKGTRQTEKCEAPNTGVSQCVIFEVSAVTPPEIITAVGIDDTL